MNTLCNTKAQKIDRLKQIEEEAKTIKLQIEEEDAEDAQILEEAQGSYEEVLKTEPWLVNQEIQDTESFTHELLKAVSNEKIEKLLDMFEGRTLTKKKKTLTIFLKEFPAYKTKDFFKLYTRLKILRLQGRKALESNTDETGFYTKCQQFGFKF